MKSSSTRRSTFAASATFLVLVWTATREIRPIRWSGDPELVRLVAEKKRLQGNTDSLRDGLRSEWQARQRSAWSNRAVNELRNGMESVLKSESLSSVDPDRRVRFVASAKEMIAWEMLLGTLATLEQMPGVAIESL